MNQPQVSDFNEMTLVKNVQMQLSVLLVKCTCLKTQLTYDKIDQMESTMIFQLVHERHAEHHD